MYIYSKVQSVIEYIINNRWYYKTYFYLLLLSIWDKFIISIVISFHIPSLHVLQLFYANSCSCSNGRCVQHIINEVYVIEFIQNLTGWLITLLLCSLPFKVYLNVWLKLDLCRGKHLLFSALVYLYPCAELIVHAKCE